MNPGKYAVRSTDKFHAVSTILQIHRRSHWRCSIKKAFLKNFAIFTGKHMCWSLSWSNFIKKNSNTGVCYEYCNLLKNTYFGEHLRAAASRYISKKKKLWLKTKKTWICNVTDKKTETKNKKLGLKKRNTLDLSVFISNTGINEPENLWIRTLFTQCKNWGNFH